MNSEFINRYGPWAIITGATSGIGKAFAHAVAQRGVHPLLLARREDELKRVAAEVKAATGVDCDYIVLDLASPEFIAVLERYCAGRDIGLVVSNAGYNPAGEFLAHEEKELLRILDVNSRAALLLAHTFLPLMKQRKSGGFLLIGSIEGFIGSPFSAVYSASKAFIQSLGEALWGEFKQHKVDVLVVSPGATDTPLLASRNVSNIPGVMSPDAVAQFGLDRLNRGPGGVPGMINKMQIVLLRILPRKWAVSLVGAAMKKVIAKA